VEERERERERDRGKKTPPFKPLTQAGEELAWAVWLARVRLWETEMETEQKERGNSGEREQGVRKRESERRGREEAAEIKENRFRVFFFSFYTEAGWIGAGRVLATK
jgi:hypothetical protein